MSRLNKIICEKADFFFLRYDISANSYLKTCLKKNESDKL